MGMEVGEGLEEGLPEETCLRTKSDLEFLRLTLIVLEATKRWQTSKGLGQGLRGSLEGGWVTGPPDTKVFSP